MMLATKIGDRNREVIQTNGSKFIVTLKDVKYIPELWETCLASITHEE
jgi:hypothetical protein